MSTDPPSVAWLISWRSEIERTVKPLLADFEAIYGYPPDDNLVSTATSEARIRDGDFPRPLAVFYQVIDEVVLPDIGNGYFVHPVDHVCHSLDEEGRVLLSTGALATVFGSDGGGILFAMADDGKIHRSEAASRDSDFELVAEDLTDFLVQLRDAVIGFIESGTPGKL